MLLVEEELFPFNPTSMEAYNPRTVGWFGMVLARMRFK